MNNDMTWVAERLASEFPHLPAMVVIDTLCRCLDDCGSTSPFFVEQATRARLRLCREDDRAVLPTAL